MKPSFQTPVLILAYNRPDLVKNLLSKLDKSKISELFVSIDGPRNFTDKESANQILSHLTNFSKKLPIRIRLGKSNLGCRLGVISGLDWFFSQVPGGLILEDDCHPKPGLFEFISKNKDLNSAHRIGMITAHNPFGEVQIENYLSRFVFIHGWYMRTQTWLEIREELFSVRMPNFTSAKQRKAGISETVFWWSSYIRARIGFHDTWDSLFYRAFIAKGFYCLVPRINMIENYGFGFGATHTTNADSSILMENGPEVANNLMSSVQLDGEISRKHFKIRPRHIITSPTRVILDLLRIRNFPDFEKDLQSSQNQLIFLNQARL